MTDEARAWIERLGLSPHPEGGHFRETWRSAHEIPADALPAAYGGPRQAGTCIYFLLARGQKSAPHVVRSDELWLFHAGDPLVLTMRDAPEAEGRDVFLGQESFQELVPGGVWQEAASLGGPHGFSLVSCVVVPGFDFEDFEMLP